MSSVNSGHCQDQPFVVWGCFRCCWVVFCWFCCLFVFRIPFIILPDHWNLCLTFRRCQDLLFKAQGNLECNVAAIGYVSLYFLFVSLFFTWVNSGDRAHSKEQGHAVNSAHFYQDYTNVAKFQIGFPMYNQLDCSTYKCLHKFRCH